MKKIIATILLCTLLTGCIGSTQYGECLGAFDDGKPNLAYKVSIWNTLLAIIFFETVVVPVVVIGWYAKCPEGKK